jgi:hypothetical protein
MDFRDMQMQHWVFVILEVLHRYKCVLMLYFTKVQER